MKLKQYTDASEEIVPGDSYEVRDKDGHTALIQVFERKDGLKRTPERPDGSPGVLVHVYDLTEKKLYERVMLMGAVVDGLTAFLKAEGPGEVCPVAVERKKSGTSGRYYGKFVPVDDETMARVSKWVQKRGNPFEDAEDPRQAVRHEDAEGFSSIDTEEQGDEDAF